MEKTIPKITPSGKQKCDKWFDEKLHNTRNKVNHLKRKYRRKPSERNHQEYLDKATEYKKLCRQSRDEDFKGFLETMPDIKSLSSFHKKCFQSKAPANQQP